MSNNLSDDPSKPLATCKRSKLKPPVQKPPLTSASGQPWSS
eukprot:CAMPEP_0183500606 /NCGR_PEP_ID=MMETSP0371-20130417/2651_1 /TAXON_ID=268820 /ORGANISM="Peridinium aciculiferum, Strain PAER-2" /LENGTH=40 /DNA_ID= /DNA_START= /DNA_END= /DNA_ORIENTATION=